MTLEELLDGMPDDFSVVKTSGVLSLVDDYDATLCTAATAVQLVEVAGKCKDMWQRRAQLEAELERLQDRCEEIDKELDELHKSHAT